MTPGDCPGFTWSGRSLIACDHCNRDAWEHETRVTRDGNPAPWPTGLVGYWFHQGHITRDRARQLRGNPPATPTATP